MTADEEYLLVIFCAGKASLSYIFVFVFFWSGSCSLCTVSAIIGVVLKCDACIGYELLTLFYLKMFVYEEDSNNLWVQLFIVCCCRSHKRSVIEINWKGVGA